MINCKKAHKLINSYLDGEITERKLKKLNYHLGKCGSCRTSHEDLSKTVDLLDDMKDNERVRVISALNDFALDEIKNRNIHIKKIKYAVSFAAVFLIALGIIFYPRTYVSPCQKGFSYLFETQNNDGSWDSAIYKDSVAVTSLVLLASLEHRESGYMNRYKKKIEKGIEFIQNSCKNGLLTGPDESAVSMYTHGIAVSALFKLSKAGFAINKDILEKAVNVIVGSQNKKGGWRYLPIPYDDDICVTGTQLVTLSQLAGNPSFNSVNKGVNYIKKCSQDTGGFSYSPERKDVSLTRTIIGIASLACNGQLNSKESKSAIKYLKSSKVHFENDIYSYYSLIFYKQLSEYIREDKQLQEKYKTVKTDLLKLQQKDGSWDNKMGKAYATSIALLVLRS